MDNTRVCKTCKEKRVIFDPTSNSYLCDACGREQNLDPDYQTHLTGFDGPQGTFHRIPTTVRSSVGQINGQQIYIGGVSSYRDKKLFDASQNIEEITSKLGFSAAKSAEVKLMIEEITKGEFGSGDWFLILIGACSYIVMRKNKIPFSIAEAAAAIGCEIPVIGRMINRIIGFLNLRLPEFDIIVSFERAIRACNGFVGVERETMDVMLKQGRFLLECCVKWFLTTGRQPLPMVAAVLVFVGEMNQVRVSIEDVAKEIYAGVSTSKMRYKELKISLLKVARGLPWGKEISVKNLVQNAGTILQYMEMKSKLKDSGCSVDDSNGKTPIRFDLQDCISRCLTKEFEFDYMEDDYSLGNENGCRYFEVEDKNGEYNATHDELEKLKLSQECLWSTYTEFLSRCDYVKSKGGEIGDVHRRKRKRGGASLGCMEWWVGKSDLNKKLSLNQILQRNVGFDAFPPSFVAGEEACRKRREKIIAAKLRIDKIMHPNTVVSSSVKDIALLEQLKDGKSRRKGRKGCDIDCEDNIIELLLLHQVNEEQIEQGHYKTLLDLHVFNYLGIYKTSSQSADASQRHQHP
ncbi:POLLEN-EXPRESSED TRANSCRIPTION FACTOR 2 [Tasmannia lanceolata]|uniref:POLLEN-EXPRESSED TRANSCRIPTION FACTOR 2 n=1 Tax=Tasmannia lanceolata TaxID=3420 RepID=UPI004062F994